jgi:hypothetical protein
MCSASRYLLFGWLAGMITASITGSALLGWMAAGLAVGAMYGLSRRYPGQLGAASCPMPPRSISDEHDSTTSSG